MHLYYKASKDDSVNLKYIYRMPATVNAITSLSEQQITYDEYDTFYFLDNETSGYIVQNSSKTYYLPYNDTKEAKPIADSKLEIMTINNNYIYYKSSNTIKRINYYNFALTGDKTEQTVIIIENLKSYQYDIDENYLYVYADKGENTY